MIKLSCGRSSVTLMSSGKDYVDMEVIALTPGVFVNAENGEDVVITDEHIQQLHDIYNARVDQERTKFSKKLKRIVHINDDVELTPVMDNNLLPKPEDITVAPIHQDHIVAQTTMVGRIVGKLSLARDDDKTLCLLARLRIMTDENVKKVNLGMFQAVSLGFNLEPDYHISEISFVPYGACPSAGKVQGTLLSKTVENEIKLSANMMKLQAIKNKYISLKAEKEKLEVKLHIKKITNTLISRGRLYPKDARRIENDLVLFKNLDDLRIVKNIFNRLPTMDSFKTFSRNRDAVNFEELLKMSSTEQQNTIKNILSKVYKKNKGQVSLKGDYLDSRDQTALKDEEDKKVEMADEKHEAEEQVNMTRDQFCHMKKLAEEKNHDELLKMMEAHFPAVEGKMADEIGQPHGAADEKYEGHSRSLLKAIEETNTKLAEVQKELVSFSNLKNLDVAEIKFVATTLKEIIEQDKAGK